MGKILIVDDEKKIREFISFFLKREGYKVLEAGNGKEALKMIDEENISLIILDYLMPIMNGFEVCEKIRKFSDIPIIMLTAVEGEQNHIDGYNKGVDDYITKPFKTNILIAKIKRIIAKNNKNIIRIGLLRVEVDKKSVFADNNKIALSPKEYDLFEYMIINKNIALSREKILEAIWGYDYEGGERVVDNHIKKLRNKLGAYCNNIKTVVGYGYMVEV